MVVTDDYLRARPELVARFRLPDAEASKSAQAVVYREYWPRLDAYLRALGVKREEERHDILADAFVRAFKPKNRAAYDGKRDYWRLISRITRNVFLNRLRDAKLEKLLPFRRSSPDEGLLESLIDATSAPDPDAEHGWLEPRARAIARQYVATLTGDLRAVHDARYVECLSQEAAGEHLGLSRPKVRDLEDRLRRELLDLLNAAGIRATLPSVTPAEGAASHG